MSTQKATKHDIDANESSSSSSSDESVSHASKKKKTESSSSSSSSSSSDSEEDPPFDRVPRHKQKEKEQERRARAEQEKERIKAIENRKKEREQSSSSSSSSHCASSSNYASCSSSYDALTKKATAIKKSVGQGKMDYKAFLYFYFNGKDYAGRDYETRVGANVFQKYTEGTSQGITHTKLPDPSKNGGKGEGAGGSYFIPQDQLEEYWRLHYIYTFQQKEVCRVSEYCLIDRGPLAVDFDFHYHDDHGGVRRHTKEDVKYIIKLFFAAINTCVSLGSDTTCIKVYVMQRNTGYFKDNKKIYSDGIHIYFAIDLEHKLQLYIRHLVLRKLEKPQKSHKNNVAEYEDSEAKDAGSDYNSSDEEDEVDENEPYEKLKHLLRDEKDDWGRVIDKQVMTGKSPWPMYGAVKPGKEPYRVTDYYQVRGTLDMNTWNYDHDDQINFHEFTRPKVNVDLIKELSIQNSNHPKYELRDDIRHDDDYIEFLDELNRCGAKARKQNDKDNEGGEGEDEADDVLDAAALRKKIWIEMMSNMEDPVDVVIAKKGLKVDATLIKSKEDALRMAEMAIDFLINGQKGFAQYQYLDARTVHEMVLNLPEKYYRAGDSHNENISIAYALRNYHDSMFYTWICLRAKSSDWDPSEVETKLEIWKTLKQPTTQENMISENSIFYIMRTTNSKMFAEIRSRCVKTLLENSINGTDYDMASVLYQMFRKYFKFCDGQWYAFRNHCFEKSDESELKKRISTTLYNKYDCMEKDYIAQLMLLKNTPENPEEQEKYKTISDSIDLLHKVKRYCKMSSSKNAIMKELQGLFTDIKFHEKCDSNPYLLCCKNGVVDFKNKTFRNGMPDDYLTCSTGNEYRELDEVRDRETIDKIMDFFSKVFPDEELREFMLDHCAASLIGEKQEEAFYCYMGQGANGKSKLSELQKHTLGRYFGFLDPVVLTAPRKSMGGPSSELVKIKPCRFVLFGELTEGSLINDGVLKQYSGGEEIQARELFQKAISFKTQATWCFSSNNRPKIKDTTDGTWRRIKECPFKSKFWPHGIPKEFRHDTKFHHEADANMSNEIKTWAPVFLSMLVERAFRTEGKMKKCSIVENATLMYRSDQNMLMRFIDDYFAFEADPTMYPTLRPEKRDISKYVNAWCEYNLFSTKSLKIATVNKVMTEKFKLIDVNRTRVYGNARVIFGDDVYIHDASVYYENKKKAEELGDNGEEQDDDDNNQEQQEEDEEEKEEDDNQEDDNEEEKKEEERKRKREDEITMATARETTMGNAKKNKAIVDSFVIVPSSL